MFYDGSTYDYHFIIKELAKEFEGQFKWLGKNTEKYITFSVPIKNEEKLHTTLGLCQAHYQVLLIILLIDFTMITYTMILYML